MRPVPVLLVGVLTLTLAACGTATDPAPGGEVPRDQDVDLVGHGILLQATAEGPVELCLGGVAESYPPQCGGPVLKGAFSWDDVDASRQGGVTWTEQPYWVVGRYDPDAGDQGSFTLAGPPTADPPAGHEPPAATGADFPQLCEDPTADVPDVDQGARSRGPDGTAQEQALMELTASLEGYVTSWLSDGGPTFNVLVTGDPDVARERIREVFHGPLCVEQRDLPTERAVRAAQGALLERAGELAMLSSGSGVSGLLEVEVVVAGTATVERVHEIVAGWLTPEQVVVRGALRPLGQP